MNKHDAVQNPSHYDLFPGQQVIDIIRATLTPEEFAGYLKGNVLKYRLRAGEKGDPVEDLGKAAKYRSWLYEFTPKGGALSGERLENTLEALTNSSNWIQWDGRAPMPVPKGVKIDVRDHDGEEWLGVKAGDYSNEPQHWCYVGLDAGSIVAWRFSVQ